MPNINRVLPYKIERKLANGYNYYKQYVVGPNGYIGKPFDDLNTYADDLVIMLNEAYLIGYNDRIVENMERL